MYSRWWDRNPQLVLLCSKSRKVYIMYICMCNIHVVLWRNSPILAIFKYYSFLHHTVYYCMDEYHHHRFIVRFPIGFDYPLITLPGPGVLMKSLEQHFFTTGCPSWHQPHAWGAVSNSSKYNILAGTQLIQLYKFVCTIPTQNIHINLRCKTAL